MREACLRLKEQVSSLGQRYAETPPGDERDPKVARVIYIRIRRPTSPKVCAPVWMMRKQRRKRQTKGTAREGPTVSPPIGCRRTPEHKEDTP